MPAEDSRTRVDKDQEHRNIRRTNSLLSEVFL